MVKKSVSTSSKKEDTSGSDVSAGKKNVVEDKKVDKNDKKEEKLPEVVNDTEGDVSEVSELSELDKLLEMFSALELQMKDMKTQIKAVQKENVKNKKILNKEKARKEKARKSPSGFAKPTKISNEMCDFMKISRGSEKSRTEVTRSINQYIKANNLNNPTNKRLIIPDATLKKLLSLKDNEQISFFHMQKYLTPHVKVESVAAK
jgi:chromatin remodeling complex protein RSC6